MRSRNHAVLPRITSILQETIMDIKCSSNSVPLAACTRVQHTGQCICNSAPWRKPCIHAGHHRLVLARSLQPTCSYGCAVRENSADPCGEKHSRSRSAPKPQITFLASLVKNMSRRARCVVFCPWCDRVVQRAVGHDDCGRGGNMVRRMHVPVSISTIL